MTIDELEPSATALFAAQPFQKVDWFCFALTTLVTLTVYLLTLTPEVTLGYSGIFSAGAMYSSPSMPPGHPLWAIYGWCFTKLLPFSNIAWRLSAASATAGALACGVLALTVSSTGFLLAQEVPSLKVFSPRQLATCRLICGAVAGLGLGFDAGFWPKSVLPDTWPLSMCLFAFTICALSRWFFSSQRRHYLYLAVFAHGLTLSESQAFFPVTFAFPFLVSLGNRKLGQQMFLGVTLCLFGVLALKGPLQTLGWNISTGSRNLIIGAALITTFSWAGSWFVTRSFFCEWKAAAACAALLVAGISFYFLLPVFSMTTPPINWGYPRTGEGFFHLVSRGQWEPLSPTGSFYRLLLEWKMYWSFAAADLGLYLVPAALPFVFLKQTPALLRRWLMGCLVFWFLTTLLMLVALNVPDYSDQLVRPFFAPTHLVLLLLAGCGLMLFAATIAKPISAKS